VTDEVVYLGRDLEAMAFAVNYHRWILEFFGPHLGRRVVEVGAGTGALSELVLERPLESLSLLEPSSTMYEVLRRNVGRLDAPARLLVYNSTLGPVADQLKSIQNPDSMVYVNVLEHIDDDDGELKTAHETLGRGGKLFIFVPALKGLYTKFDEQLGHFRRYAKTELEEKCRRAGFTVLTSAYFDLLGITPWWVKYKLLRSGTMEPRAVQLYDKYVVPCARLLESAIKPPLGKNVILVAQRG
jgi:SAM-dependent methyltransferase